jgi:uncharacterized protein YndB with AHSA1/START domain
MSPTPTGEVRRTAAGRDLVLIRDLAGSIDDAWASLTESDRTGRWFASWTGDGRVGGAIVLTLVAEEGSPTSPATVEACEPPTRLAVRTEEASGGWSLEALLEPLGPDRTRLTFVHHLADDARAEAREAGRLELEMRLAGIEAERIAVRDMFRSGAINDHTARALFTEITLTEALLKGRQERK